jgi:hypothetical protein
MGDWVGLGGWTQYEGMNTPCLIQDGYIAASNGPAMAYQAFTEIASGPNVHKQGYDVPNLYFNVKAGDFVYAQFWSCDNVGSRVRRCMRGQSSWPSFTSSPRSMRTRTSASSRHSAGDGAAEPRRARIVSTVDAGAGEKTSPKMRSARRPVKSSRARRPFSGSTSEISQP